MSDFRSGLRFLSVVFCFFLASCSTCEKFVNYKNSTVDIAGIKARIGDKVDAGIGTLKLDPKFREVSEEIQKLDMVQYNICMNLEKMSQGEERTRQEQNYNAALINMYQKIVNPSAIDQPITNEMKKQPQAQSGDSKELGLIKRSGADVLIHLDIVKLITNFNPEKPVYVAYGEPAGCGPRGNEWNPLSNASKYILEKEGNYFRAKGMLNKQFQIVQLKENREGRIVYSWAQLIRAADALGEYYFDGLDCADNPRKAIWVKQ